jgi:hypothetical protein
MPSRLWYIGALWALLAVCLPAQGQQAAHPNTSKAVVSQSSWNSGFELFGVTRDLYNQNQLSRLTPEEIVTVTGAAWTKGFADGQAAVLPSCGPTGKDIDRSTVNYSSTSPMTQTVKSQAACEVSYGQFPTYDCSFLVATRTPLSQWLRLRTTLKTQTRFLAIHSPISLRALAQFRSPGVPFSFDINLVNGLQTAGTTSELVESVVATFDTNVCEKVWKWNSEIVKAGKQTQ